MICPLTKSAQLILIDFVLREVEHMAHMVHAEKQEASLAVQLIS